MQDPVFVSIEIEPRMPKEYIRSIHWVTLGSVAQRDGFDIDPTTHVAWEPVVAFITSPRSIWAPSELAFRSVSNGCMSVAEGAQTIALTLCGRLVLSLRPEADKPLIEGLLAAGRAECPFSIESVDAYFTENLHIERVRYSELKKKANFPLAPGIFAAHYMVILWELLQNERRG